ncbi:MAG TPA: 16S rRNA (guanine(527)-N(7))-methyltransferase RsmG [Candidatus Udaeobacter sp.]|nr:16S rRNA (guanine(527)-N(7))-methyltransferase RsmG [Candidatus Udaeobacter sp.]
MRELEAAGVHFDANVVRPMFARYIARVRAVGAEMNLVSSADRARIGRRHLLESFNVLNCPVDLGTGPLCDAGSGAGFPGLPLAILFPELRAVLVESLRKKARFLTETVAMLGLAERVTVQPERAEDLAARAPWRGMFALVTARGLGPLDRILPWCAPLLSEGGHLIAFKGSRIDPELAAAAGAMQAGRLDLRDLIPMRWGEGTLVVLRKRGAAGAPPKAPAGTSPVAGE